MDGAAEHRGSRNVATDAQLNRVQHRNFCEEPADRGVGIVETLLSEEAVGLRGGEITIRVVNFAGEPIDTQGQLRRGQLQAVGANLATLIQRECALDFAPEHVRLVVVGDFACKDGEGVFQQLQLDLLTSEK